MTDAAADVLIASALDRLFDAETGLPPDVSERTVAGLLGRHLEYALRESPAAGAGWSVDCEYNRLGLDPKRVPQLSVRPPDMVALLGRQPTGQKTNPGGDLPQESGGEDDGLDRGESVQVARSDRA